MLVDKLSQQEITKFVVENLEPTAVYKSHKYSKEYNFYIYEFMILAKNNSMASIIISFSDRHFSFIAKGQDKKYSRKEIESIWHEFLISKFKNTESIK